VTETTAMLLIILQYLIAPGVAGALASALFQTIRRRAGLKAWCARHYQRPDGFVLSWALFSPRGALLSALALAAAISGMASVAVAALSGGDVLAALDTALAAALSAIWSQIAYRFGVKQS